MPSYVNSVEHLNGFHDKLVTVLQLLQSTGAALRMQGRTGLPADRTVLVKSQEMCGSVAAMLKDYRGDFLVARCVGTWLPEAACLVTKIGALFDQIADLLPIVTEAVEQSLLRSTRDVLADAGLGDMFDQQTLNRVMGNGVPGVHTEMSLAGQYAFIPAIASCTAGTFVEPKLVVAFGETILPLDAEPFLDSSARSTIMFLGHALAFQQEGATACAMIYEAEGLAQRTSSPSMDTLALTDETAAGGSAYLFSITPEEDSRRPRVLHLLKSTGPHRLPAGASFLGALSLESTPGGARMPPELRRSIEDVATEVRRKIKFFKEKSGN